MSQDDSQVDPQVDLADDLPTITAPRGVPLTPRTIAAMALAFVLVVATGVGLVVSKDRKDRDVANGVARTGRPVSQDPASFRANPKAVAAKVNGQTITNADLDAVVKSWTSNKAFVEASAAQGSPLVDDKGVVVPAYRAERLHAMIQQQVFDAEFERRGLKVSEAFVSELRGQVTADPSAAGFSDEFINDFVESRARFDALRTSMLPEVTDDAVQAAYEQKYTCASGKSVAHILVPTQEAADAALARVQAGEDFGAVAREVSTDGSNTKGGDLGCFAQGQFVAEFENAALAAVIDVPTAPVKSQFGYHIIKMTAYVAPPLAEVREAIVAELQANDSSAQAQLVKLLEDADIEVAPAIGTWSVSDLGVPELVPATGSQDDGETPQRQLEPAIKVLDERPPTK